MPAVGGKRRISAVPGLENQTRVLDKLDDLMRLGVPESLISMALPDVVHFNRRHRKIESRLDGIWRYRGTIENFAIDSFRLEHHH
jgi:hypothetical protein